MLTADDLASAWEQQIKAEIRSLYFADLTVKYSRRKQVITFANFFLASGAAATLLGKAPAWVAIALSLFSALCTAYVVATGLDRKIATLSKLQGDWSLLAIEYERIRKHPESEEAVSTYAVLTQRGVDASKLAASDTPYKKKLVDYWTEQVFKSHGLEYA